MNYEYNKLLKFLYFEGYADSYEEAEYLLEDLDDDEFEELLDVYETRDLSSQTIKIRPGAIAGGEGSVFRGITGALPDPNSEEEQNRRERRRKRGKLTFDVREEFKDLTPEKEARVTEKMQLLKKSVSGIADKTNELVKRIRTNKIKSGQFRNILLPGRRRRLEKEAENINKEHQANIKGAKKSAELHSNAADSLINTIVSRDVRDRGPAVKAHLERSFKKDHSTNNIRRFQREEFILEYLLLNGYVNSYDSAIAIYESMSDEWINDILEVFKGEGQEYEEYHKKKHRDHNDDARKAYDAAYIKNEYGGENARPDPREKHNDARGVKERRGVK